MTADDYVAAIRDLMERIADTDRLRLERDRLIAGLRRDHGWSHRQIADAVGISYARVKQVLDDQGQR